MLHANLAAVHQAIRSASTLTEATFLHAGQALEESIEILGKLTAGFEKMLDGLGGENLDQALAALSRTAAQVDGLGRELLSESARFQRARCLTESIGQRIAQMKASLKGIEAVAVNSKIAAANIDAGSGDFMTFADEIGRTLDVTKRTLDSFAGELLVVHRQVAAAHEGQLRFQKFEHDTAGPLTERLSATVRSIALRHEHAARSGREVKQSSVRVRQRICNAILALQIGDITRQRLEHAEAALDLVAGAGDAIADAGEQRMFASAIHRLQSAQLLSSGREFERDVHRVTESLTSLAGEARALRSLGDAAYGASDRDAVSFIVELDGQIGEALVLLEGFESARADVAIVAETVSRSTASLRGYLQKVQSLEADIRIMGLNTTFKCARIGREGLALSLIAQELRTYANGFAKEAGALMEEVENVARITGASSETEEPAPLLSGGALAMRESLGTLRQMGQVLDVAMADLDRDSVSVVALLEETAANLRARNDIGGVLRAVAGSLTALSPRGHLNFSRLPPDVDRMLEVMARGYTMANEREVHDRVLGRAEESAPVTAAAAELEDFLF